jgi:hypothetical protein
MTKLPDPIIQQGELGLIPRAKFPNPLPPGTTPMPIEHGRHYIMRNKTTGHQHSVSATDATLLNNSGYLLLLVYRETSLEDQDHATLPLMPGAYSVYTVHPCIRLGPFSAPKPIPFPQG